MKIRNGFVSNSSSSSFVVAGYKLSENTYDENLIDKLDTEDLYVVESNGNYYIGCRLAEINDYSIEPTVTDEIDVKYIKERVLEFIKKENLAYIDNFSIITGDEEN